MKRIIVGLIVGFLLLVITPVNAENLQLVVNEKDGKYVITVRDGENDYDYKNVMEKYDLDSYLKFYYGDVILYFYNGDEITEDEYIKGSLNLEADKRCAELKDMCIRVHNTDDIIASLDKVYNEKKPNNYYLIYSEYEYEHLIDFKQIEEHISTKYIIELNKNMYKYDEYAYYGLIREMPIYSETEMKIDFLDTKIVSAEEKAVNQFLDYFLPLLDGKSDYEKILGVYSYLSQTSTYITDEEGYEYLVDAKLSAYDVLLKKEYVCIGMATTFQLLMEKLGIESYIVDELYSGSDAVGSVHTYNAVKLDDKWYIVDISNNFNGFLTTDNDYDKKYYYDIDVSDETYFTTNPDAARDFYFDYAAIDIEIDKILNAQVKTEKLEEKKEDIKDYNYWSYMILSLILIIIFIIVVIFTRKEKNKDK